MAWATSDRTPATAPPVTPPATLVWDPGTRTVPYARLPLCISPTTESPTVLPATLPPLTLRSAWPAPWAATPVPGLTAASPAPQAGRPRTTQGSARLPLPSSASPASTEGAGPAWPVTPPAGPARGTERRTAPGATQTTNSSGQPAVLPVLQVRALHHSTLYPLYCVVRLLPIRPGKLLYQLPALLPDL